MFRLPRKPVRLDVAPGDHWPVYEIRPRERRGVVLGLFRRFFPRRKAEAPPGRREGGPR
jgi:hypothetical protein